MIGHGPSVSIADGTLSSIVNGDGQKLLRGDDGWLMCLASKVEDDIARSLQVDTPQRRSNLEQ